MPSVHPYFIPVFEREEGEIVETRMYDSFSETYFENVDEYVGLLGLNIEEANELKIILLKENGKLCD